MEKDQSQITKSELKRWRRRSQNRILLQILAALVILATAAGIFVNYLSNLPRERHSKRYSLVERTKLGWDSLTKATALTMSAEQEPENTRLPVAELLIKGSRMDKLFADLPESGDNEQKAKFRYLNTDYDIKARLRGDSVNHWAFPQKSWRITARGDDEVQGATAWNLTVPRSETQLANWLGYQIARKFPDLIVPASELVQFRLNRQFDGIRHMFEQPNLEFIENRGLPAGKIYTGDISSEQIYGRVPRKRLYLDSTAWQVDSSTNEAGAEELRQLLTDIGQEHNPYRFYDKMNEQFNMPALLQYIAMLELVGSVHVDSTHNGKFYYNPVSGKFAPIVWDTVAYFWGNSQRFDLAPNELFQVVLQNPQFRADKDRYLWQAINGELSTKQILTLVEEAVVNAGNDIAAFALKVAANDKGIEHISNEEWLAALKQLKKSIIERNSAIRRRLQTATFDYNYQLSSANELLLMLHIPAVSGVEVGQVNISFDQAVNFNEGSAVLKRKRLGDIAYDGQKSPALRQMAKGEQVSGRTLSFTLDDKLESKRRKVERGGLEIVPADYVYALRLPENFSGKVREISLTAKNSITGTPVNGQFKPDLIVKKTQRENINWWNPQDYREQQEILWEKSVRVDQDVTVNPQTILRIAAGSQVKLGKGVSILINGGTVIIEGSAEAGVSISAADPAEKWGTIAVFNNGKLDASYLDLSGGSNDQYRQISFLAPLSAHYGNLKVTDSKFDHYVSLNHSTAQLLRNKFESIFAEPIVQEGSVVDTRDNQVQVTKLVHKFADRSLRAVGTAGRWEREYKYTFTDLDAESAKDPLAIADEIRQALTNSLSEHAEQWHVPKLVSAPLRTDSKVEAYIYSDIYFDTKDYLNHKYDVSYRYRNRYPSRKAYERHLKDYDRRAYWPYRLEYQAKTKRVELGGGFSRTLESRFEFRPESQPFSQQNLPPTAPWSEDVFLPYFKVGKFNGQLTAAAKAMLKFYVDKVDPEQRPELEFLPQVVLMTDRFRQHLNVLTEYGSGPNPEQSYIISMDRVTIYAAEEYLKFKKIRKLGNKRFPLPTPIGYLTEIEVEFERNVSDVLDRKISLAAKNKDEAELAKLKQVRAAFMHDQETIMREISLYFSEQGITVKPIGKSKFVQSMDIFRKTNLN